ncbi:MAG: PH domain-containing protein [Bryobacteraceae bacterium]
MPPGESQSFSASFDSTTKIVSVVVFVVLLLAAAVTRSAIVAGLGAAVILLSFAYSPRGYAILERSIVVNRLIGNVRIALDGIREIRAATTDDFRGCLRLWGSGGLFGYYGIFQTSRLGRGTWYVTNRSNAVVVITDAKTVLFSPDNVDGFITAIRVAAPLPQFAVAGPSLRSRQFSGSGSSILKLVGLAVGIGVVAFVTFALLYSPGPPSYTLTPEALTIHDRFYPVTAKAAAVALEHIRIVDLGTDTDWRPVARTNGFANAHYQSGWFRVANGQKVRMYRAGSSRLVLLPPRGDGAAVLLETGEPEKFVAELRREWSRPSQ